MREAGARRLTSVTCERAEPDDVGSGGWNAIVCAFGLWKVSDRIRLLKAWATALVPSGKIGILTFGPPDNQDPFEMLAQALRELEPDAVATPARIASDRESMTRMFEDAGLSLVRHAPRPSSHAHVPERRGVHRRHP